MWCDGAADAHMVATAVRAFVVARDAGASVAFGVAAGVFVACDSDVAAAAAR